MKGIGGADRATNAKMTGGKRFVMSQEPLSQLSEKKWRTGRIVDVAVDMASLANCVARLQGRHLCMRRFRGNDPLEPDDRCNCKGRSTGHPSCEGSCVQPMLQMQMCNILLYLWYINWPHSLIFQSPSSSHNLGLFRCKDLDRPDTEPQVLVFETRSAPTT